MCVRALFFSVDNVFFNLFFSPIGLSDDGEFEGVCVCASRRDRAFIEP